MWVVAHEAIERGSEDRSKRALCATWWSLSFIQKAKRNHWRIFSSTSFEFGSTKKLKGLQWTFIQLTTSTVNVLLQLIHHISIHVWISLSAVMGFHQATELRRAHSGSSRENRQESDYWVQMKSRGWGSELTVAVGTEMEATHVSCRWRQKKQWDLWLALGRRWRKEGRMPLKL